MPFHVKLISAAQDDFARLDKGLQAQAARQLLKLRDAPEAGESLGNQAGFDLRGYRALHFARNRWRIVYRVDAAAEIVWVIVIGPKARFEAYRLAAQRSRKG